MSKLDDSLAGFQNNPKIPNAYDSLVEKLPVSDETKGSMREGGRAIGTGFMVGLRKIASVVEGAINGGIDRAREPLAETGPMDPTASEDHPGEQTDDPGMAEPMSDSSPAGHTAFLDELERLDRLHRSGGLTDGEYSAAKARFLGL
ncbi:MAG TPA: hypothetical protein VFC82_05310 [Actinomycetaceae bacterium]|nr:hypothetical protein [Actinomycetaceae bacterium]